MNIKMYNLFKKCGFRFAGQMEFMGKTATMCKENNLPIIVFDMDTNGNLKKVMSGENIGTLVHN